MSSKLEGQLTLMECIYNWLKNMIFFLYLLLKVLHTFNSPVLFHVMGQDYQILGVIQGILSKRGLFLVRVKVIIIKEGISSSTMRSKIEKKHKLKCSISSLKMIVSVKLICLGGFEFHFVVEQTQKSLSIWLCLDIILYQNQNFVTDVFSV